MTNEFTLENARNLTDQQLVDALKEGLAMSEEGIRHAAISVAVLEERGRDMSMLPDTFRYAREIAEGQLSPHAAWLLARIPHAIRSILPLPLDMQDEIADGMKIKIAVRKDGRTMSDERTIYEMSQLQMRLAFSETGISPFDNQAKWLIQNEANGDKHRNTPKITATKSGEIIVGRTHLTVDDLIPALSALGYVVKPIYGRKKIKPAEVK
ncbi:hypothetical protein [Celeribacter halophilus]|uniref:Uncharacterized protein n=1 Tax=Celeribacter halophilus TaxID=576117 RepID=A0A1I3XAD9_9RHOB|nr:hypothetical protein [Celeribacter halophilus]PZX03768.1 hypothetical protein LX82_03745 [Celeribacter halophilus]SFK16534.1 hypothetical protein SAMN04488138_1462 [Celeribacter halophilus]